MMAKVARRIDHQASLPTLSCLVFFSCCGGVYDASSQIHFAAVSVPSLISLSCLVFLSCYCCVVVVCFALLFCLLYLQGVGGLTKDPNQAAFWLTRAAEQGTQQAEEGKTADQNRGERLVLHLLLSNLIRCFLFSSQWIDLHPFCFVLSFSSLPLVLLFALY